MHMDQCEKILSAIQQKVATEFSIEHTTVQLERAGLPQSSGYVMPAPAAKT
jgi:Co/Zn/Cd efflux system component